MATWFWGGSRKPSLAGSRGDAVPGEPAVSGRLLPAGLGDGTLNKPTVWFHIRALLCPPGAAMLKLVLLCSPVMFLDFVAWRIKHTTYSELICQTLLLEGF